MKKAREDNTVSVVQRAIRHYGIRVTNNSVKETLKSNSFYPTFRSICEALTEWKVEHYPMKYKPENIKDLKSPYITHFNSGGGHIAFVTGYENGRVVLYESYQNRKKIGWDEYLKEFSGAIILLNPNEKSGEKNYGQKFREELLKKIIIPSMIGVLVLLIFALLINKMFLIDHQIPWQLYVLLFIKSGGVIISAMLLMKEYEINTPLAEKLCHISKKINCNSVLNDKAAMVFSPVGWADIGMIYFTGSLLVMLLSNFPSLNGFLIIASALSLPYIIFSVWYQGFKLKRWCPFCIIVQVILVAEFLIQMSFWRIGAFSLVLFTLFGLTFLITGVIQILVNLYIRESKAATFKSGKLQKLLKNPDIFRAILFSQKHNDIKITCNSLLFGKLNSGLRITAFLSLHCSHCAGAFIKIAEVLRSDSNVLVNIILIGADSKILDTLHYLLKKRKEEEALSMLIRWYKSDQIAKSSFKDDYCMVDADEVSMEINTHYRNLVKDCEVTGTPTFFINGYRFPPQYEIDDIKYFSQIFSKEEVSLKEKGRMN